MSAIKISNKLNIKQLEKSIINVMQEWEHESEDVKKTIVAALTTSSNAPLTISNCNFTGVK